MGSNSAATAVKSKGSGGGPFPGLRNTGRAEVAGALRPRVEEPEGGGGRRPFCNR